MDKSRNNKALRILMYSAYFYPEYSGAALQAMRLARELRREGHYVEFITNRWPGLPASELVEGFRVTRLVAGRGAKHKELRLWLNMLKFIWPRRREFDVLHSHGAYYTNSIVGPLASLIGAKSVVKASLARDDLHGLGQTRSGRLHRWFLRKVDACVAISRDLEKEFLDAGLSPHRVHFLPNGVDTQTFCPVAAEEKMSLRESLCLPGNRRVFLYVGVMDQRKNIVWLASRWIENRGFGTNAILVAVGPQSREDPTGEILGRLQGLAEQHPDLFAVRTYVSDIHRYYKASDLLILPSYKEGLPNVVLEAMSSGLPCLAARSSGSRELVEEGVTGFTYEPDDPEDFARALNSCLVEGEGNLGSQARAKILVDYSIEAVASRYVEIYNKILD